jgi:hypothetical protein
MQLARLFGIAVAVLLSLLMTSPAFADDDAGAPANGDSAPATPDTPAPDVADAGPATAPPPTPASPPSPIEAPKPESNVNVRASTEVGGYIDSTATSVLTPSIGINVESPTAGWGVSGRYLVDIVSAASPDIVSTASPHWTEIRNAGNLGVRYKPGTFGVAVNASTSYTPDYLALSAGAQLTQDLDDKNLTLIGGYGYGHDTIGRSRTSFSVFSRTLDYHSITAGVSRVVNAGLVIGLYGDVVLENGDQSKPYRYIPIFTPAVAASIPVGASPTLVANSRIQPKPLEQLPLDRERYALTARLAWRGDNGTTLRVEERGYADTWGLKASTTDARYFIDLSQRWTIWPHARFNVQNSVSFWKRAYSANGLNDLPALRTGDRELSSLWTGGGGGGVRVALGRAGAVDDLVLTTTIDAFYTSFADTIYVKERLSALAATALELGF